MKRFNLFAIAICALCLANIVVQFLGGGAIQGHLLNSDTLFLPSFIEDLVAKGGRLSEWSLPPAPYFFPDLGLFLLAYCAGLSPYLQIIAVAIAQTALLFLVLWSVGRKITIPKPSVSAALVVAVLSLFALSCNKPFDFRSGGPFALMLVSVFHFGVFLASLFSITLWLSINSSEGLVKRNKSALLSFCALIFLSTVSDSFFITQALIPLTAITLCQALIERHHCTRKLLYRLSFMCLASTTGFFSSKLLTTLNTTRPNPHIGIKGSLQRLDNIADIVLHTISVYPLLMLVAVLYLVMVGGAFQRFFKDKSEPFKLDWLVLFSCLSIVSTVTSLLFLTNLPAIGARYLIPLFFWPLIIVVWGLAHWLRHYFTLIALTLVVTLVSLLTIASSDLLKSDELSLHYYPREISCIDDALESTGARQGLAQYWDARYLQTFSRLNLSVAQYSVNLDPMPFFISINRFKKSYDFAVSSNHVNRAWQIQPETLERAGGSPMLVKTCGSSTVYVFEKGQLRP